MIKFVRKRIARDRLADQLPVTIDRHRLYILPTIYGLLFLVILFAMLLGSINYNNNLGFLLVFLLGGITMVSMIHTYRNVLGIRILAINADPVFAGQTVRFKLLVACESVPRRSVGFRIDTQTPAIENISPDVEHTLILPVPARERGCVRPGRMVVWSRYPLGLFRAWTILKPDVSCMVYPKPVAGPLRFAGAGDGEDIDGRNLSHGVDDFMGLKLYQPGDPVSKISWKSLSRGLGVFTKEFSGTAAGSVMLDYEALEDANREYKLSRLTDMVIKSHNMNTEYGLALPGRVIAPDRGERHKHLCLTALALFGVDKEGGEVEGER